MSIEGKSQGASTPWPRPNPPLSSPKHPLALSAVPPSPCPTPLIHCMTPQSKQSWAQPHPASPTEELMPALTLIRQWPLAWKRIPVFVCVWWASLCRRRVELSYRMGGKEWVRFRCVPIALAFLYAFDDPDAGLGIFEVERKNAAASPLLHQAPLTPHQAKCWSGPTWAAGSRGVFVNPVNAGS